MQNYQNTKYELWKLYILQHNIFLNISILSKFRKCFGIFGVFYKINRYFEYRIRIFCI